MSSATVYATDIGNSFLKKASTTLNDVLVATDATGKSTTVNSYPGLWLSPTTSYTVNQFLLSFDLSTIPGGSTITTAVFTTTNIGTHTAGDSGSQLELVPFDWGSTVDLSDYVTKTEYSALTAVATYSLVPTLANGDVMTFTSGAPLIANLLAGGTSKFMLCNKAFRDGTTPTSENSHSTNIYACTNPVASVRPTLTITYTAGGGGGTTYNATFFGSNF